MPTDEDGVERYSDVATTFKLVSTRFNEGPAAWQVRIVSWPEDGEPNEDDVLAEATVYRAFVDLVTGGVPSRPSRRRR